MSSAYRAIVASSNDPDDVFFRNMWVKWIPSKVLLHVWKLGHNRLPTLHNLSRRGVVPGDAAVCSGYKQHLETENHLIFERSCYSRIWTACFKWIGIPTAMHNSCKDQFQQFFGLLNWSMKNRNYWQVVWYAVVWAIWLARNNQKFNSKASELEDILESIKILSWSWIKAKGADFPYQLSSWISNSSACLGLY